MYEFLLWDQDRVDKIIQVHRKRSIVYGNNIDNKIMTSSPKIIVVPVAKKSTSSIKKLSPIPIFNNVKKDIQTININPVISTNKLSIEQSPIPENGISSHKESFEIIYTPDFYQIPLKTPPFIDYATHKVEDDQKNDCNLEDNENKVLTRYHIAKNDIIQSFNIENVPKV